MIHEQYIPKVEVVEFNKKLDSVCTTLEIKPAWLLQVMYMESRLRPNAENTVFPFYRKKTIFDGYATGLIQFIPQTARDLGTTTEALKSMSRIQQLDYVLKYFMPYKGKLKSFFDVYLVVFFPAAVGKPDDYVFEAKNISRSLVARQNPAIDRNKNGEITMLEFKEYCKLGIPTAIQQEVLA